MLKIKDNVDLKELEKFRFFKSNEKVNGWSYELEPVSEDANFCTENNAYLFVREFEYDLKTKSNRELELTIMQDDECTYNFDVLYDLIKSDMVEKVVEDE